jgi:hypothetical protein
MTTEREPCWTCWGIGPLRGFYDEGTDSIRWVKGICPDCHGTGEEASPDISPAGRWGADFQV